MPLEERRRISNIEQGEASGLSGRAPENSRAQSPSEASRAGVGTPSAIPAAQRNSSRRASRRAPRAGSTCRPTGPSGMGSCITRHGSTSCGAAHALAHVEEPLEVDDALAHPLELLDGHVPAGDGADHPRVRLVHVEAEAALRGEAAEDERIADRGEVLAPHRERGLALGAAPVEAGGVLRRRAACRGGCRRAWPWRSRSTGP